MPEMWYAVELIDLSGDSFGAVLRTVDALAQYMKANGDIMSSARISAVEPAALAYLRIIETFSDD